MIPLLPTPPSAAVRIESDKQAFFGFFEAMPGLIKVTKPDDKVTLVNAFSDQLATTLEGVNGEYQMEVFDRLWQWKSVSTVKAEEHRLYVNITDHSGCFADVLSKRP